MKVLAAKPSDMSSNPRTHTMEAENQVLCPSHAPCTQTLYTDKIKIESKIKINKGISRQKWAWVITIAGPLSLTYLCQPCLLPQRFLILPASSWE